MVHHLKHLITARFVLETRLKIQQAHAKGYVKWVEMTVQKQIDKAKSVVVKKSIQKCRGNL